jgi:uncharacterized protein DUF4956
VHPVSGQRTLRYTLTHNIVARVAVYYAALAAAAALIWRVLPAGGQAVVRDTLGALMGPPREAGTVGDAFGPIGAPGVPGRSPSLVVAGAMLAAFVLALPVAWTYMWTRRMKGYRQSVVHSLILLPVVVAGVVVLVKTSLALAFSLAGIVAAVRFRNTLDDSKDAVFIFFATVLGLAAGVQVDAAVALSMLFIAIVLTLWYSDFARLPPGLEDARARRQLERAVAIANRTSEFVARIDREVLEAMAPAQLDALADRVKRRRSESDDDDGQPPPPSETRLLIVVSNPAAAKELIEPVMESHCKHWRGGAPHPVGDGTAVLEYHVTLRKHRSATALASALEKEGKPHTIRAELVAPIGS